MRFARIFTAQRLQTGADVTLDPRARRHVSQVLRLRPGDRLVLFNGDGTDFDARLTRCDRRACQVRLGAVSREEPASALQVHLGLGLSRGERMDFAIQKAVELGVDAITPLLSERSVVQLDDTRREKRLAHWTGIVISACEQCGRSRLPPVHPPSSLAGWLEGRPGGLLLYHRAGRSLPDLPALRGPVNLLIGPEGGLSDIEREHALAGGFVAVRMGPRILRTETAPIAALAAIQVLWGDFR